MSDLTYPFLRDYQTGQANLQERSYYNGYGTPTTYYPTFDPISVLASLAFLAFLLQSFATLFDRSRSIIPTIVSSRQTPEEIKIATITRRVLHALEEHGNLNVNTIENEESDIESTS